MHHTSLERISFNIVEFLHICFNIAECLHIYMLDTVSYGIEQKML